MAVPQAKVPKVEGLPLAKGTTRAEKAALSLDVIRKYSHERAGWIIAQHPTAGSRIDEGSAVRVTVAKAYPKIPSVVGLALARAEATLRKAGFKFHVVKQGTSGTPGTITSQSPVGGTESLPGRNVTLVTPNCTSGYSPCLPPASDYDCAGGSGDGPAYTEPGVVYHVTGSDPYGLDADNDGLGCE